MSNETSIKKDIMRYLYTQRGHWWRSGATSYGRSGVSDILGTYYGMTVAIEVKTPEAFRKKDSGRTKNQTEFLNSVIAAGGIGATVCSVRQVSELLKAVESDLAARFGEPYMQALR